MSRRPQSLAALVVAMLVLAGAAISEAVEAQTFPARPLRFMVGFAPGGSTDIFARLVGHTIERPLGQTVIIENRPGAAGSIAANAVVRADPDGYTYFFGNVTLLAPFFIKNGSVLGGKDLAPVAGVVMSPWLLFVRADLPVKSLADLIAYAKANPGKLNFGSPSPSNDLAMQMLKVKTGVSYVGVSYKGAGPVAAALLAGEIDMSLDSLPSYLPYLQAGKFRALFIAPVRSPLVPGLPSADEAGIANFDVALPLTVWAPNGTPAAAVQRVSAEVGRAVASPEVVEQIHKAGAEPHHATPEELLRGYNAETKFWSEAAKTANYEAQ